MGITYEQIASAKIADNKNVVVSRCSKGGYTVATQLVAVDNGVPVQMFLKGALHCNDIEALKAIRHALYEAIVADEGMPEVPTAPAK